MASARRKSVACVPASSPDRPGFGQDARSRVLRNSVGIRLACVSSARSFRSFAQPVERGNLGRQGRWATYDCVPTCVPRRPWHSGGQGGYTGLRRQRPPICCCRRNCTRAGVGVSLPPSFPVAPFRMPLSCISNAAVRSRADVAPGGEEKKFHSTLQLGMIKTNIDIESPRNLSCTSKYKWR